MTGSQYAEVAIQDVFLPIVDFVNGHKLVFTIAASSVASFGLCRWYMTGSRCHSIATLNGKTVIITGGNTGIGRETAIDLARRGARVILACRDLMRGERAAEKIRKETGNKDIDVKTLDLSSLASVRGFAKQINENEDRIDILINNAGIMMCPEWKTEDGFEWQLGVNHLGHFLMTNLLLDLLKKSSPSRIINVSSLAHESGVIDFDNLMLEGNYDPQVSYRQSKLANVLFTVELSKRLKGTGVTVNSLHPGLVYTELHRYLGDSIPTWKLWLIRLMLPIGLFVLKTAEQGAQTSIYCAVSEDLTNVTGKYFSDCKEKLTRYAQKDEEDELAKKLWEKSEELVLLNK